MHNLTTEYKYESEAPAISNEYLWPYVKAILETQLKKSDKIIDVGCGNGAIAVRMAADNYDVIAIDPSKRGIEIANERKDTKVMFAEGSAYDDLVSEYGEHHAVVSLEVVEHCYWPRIYAKNIFSLLKPGGIAVISTPFHGYWKNLALALTGKFDSHWSPLWDGGHIKFWSKATLNALLVETGFNDIQFQYVGRIPPLAKSMIAIARKPS